MVIEHKRIVGKWIALAAANGLIAVAAGAFGAHALKDSLEPRLLDVFQVGARYQMYHALALLFVAVLHSIAPSRALRMAMVAMTLGIVLFCGSLYSLSLVGWTWLGPVTPIGGVCFMFGWACLVVGGWRFGLPHQPQHG